MRKINKKTQMKIQQMAFMLMAIVLFFILAGLFWLSVKYSEIHKIASQLEQEKGVIAASFLGDSAEFTCGDYCVDTDKLIILKERLAYKNFWDFAYIEIIKVGEEAAKNPVECRRDNYPNCNLYTIYNKNKKSTREAKSFVALCRKENLNGIIYDQCELGFLKIGYEIK